MSPVITTSRESNYLIYGVFGKTVENVVKNKLLEPCANGRIEEESWGQEMGRSNFLSSIVLSSLVRKKEHHMRIFSSSYYGHKNVPP